MKSHLFALALVSLASVGGVASAADKKSDSPCKGDLVVDAGIGVGLIDAGQSKAMFTQRIGAEWVVLPKLIDNRLSLSAGIYINNAYGKVGEVELVTDDYYYTMTTKSQATGTTYNNVSRAYDGTAIIAFKREDLNFLPTVSLRYRFTPRLDAYLSLGVGLGIMHSMVGVKGDVDEFYEEPYSRPYYYDDEEPGFGYVDWDDMSTTKATAALAAYIGVRYALTSNWGINGQFGLISGNIKKSMGSSYNLFSVGASYKF